MSSILASILNLAMGQCGKQIDTSHVQQILLMVKMIEILCTSDNVLVLKLQRDC